jgi:hypothetical protein
MKLGALTYAMHEKAPDVIRDWVSRELWRYQTVVSAAAALHHRCGIEKRLPYDSFTIDVIRGRASVSLGGVELLSIT